MHTHSEIPVQGVCWPHSKIPETRFVNCAAVVIDWSTKEIIDSHSLYSHKHILLQSDVDWLSTALLVTILLTDTADTHTYITPPPPPTHTHTAVILTDWSTTALLVMKLLTATDDIHTNFFFFLNGHPPPHKKHGTPAHNLPPYQFGCKRLHGSDDIVQTTKMDWRSMQSLGLKYNSYRTVNTTTASHSPFLWVSLQRASNPHSHFNVQPEASEGQKQEKRANTEK